MVKPDPLQQDPVTHKTSGKPELIQIQGTSPAQSNAVSILLQGNKYANEFDVSGGSDNNWTLTMKPIFENDLERRTVEQAIDTIRDRVDTLGVSEPLIQEYNLGANQILVELPGISDLDQVKNVIKSTARLEIHPIVGDGSGYPDEQSALASVGGALPPDEYIVPCLGEMACGNNPGTVFILERAPVVAGSDFRSAVPTTNSNTGQQQVSFTLTDEAGDKFWDYTSANVGKYMAVVMGDHVRSNAVIKSAIRDSGVIEGRFSQEEVMELSKLLQHRHAARRSLLHRGQHRGSDAWRRLHPRGRHGGDCGRGPGHGLHAHLLPQLRHQRRSGIDLQPDHPARHPGALQRIIRRSAAAASRSRSPCPASLESFSPSAWAWIRTC